MSGYSQPTGLTEGSPGVFYGVRKVSLTGQGAAFSVTPQGVTTTLATFPTHYNIDSPMVNGPNGRTYSSDRFSADPATVFSINSMPGSVRTYSPQAVIPVLSQSLPNSTFLGTAPNAHNQVPWSLVTVALNGAATLLYQFPTERTVSNAIYATDGNYYGIASGNSTYVYRVTPSGSFSELYTFPSAPFPFAGMPPSSLLQARDDSLYGILPSGGANGTGAVFRLTLSGEYKLLYSFPAGPNGGPTSQIEGSDGNLYGATQGYVYGGPYGYGLLFRLTTSGKYTLLLAMDNGAVSGSYQCTRDAGYDLRPGHRHAEAQAAGAAVHAAIGLGRNAGADLGVESVFRRRRLQRRGRGDGFQQRPELSLRHRSRGAPTGPITITTPGGNLHHQGELHSTIVRRYELGVAGLAHGFQFQTALLQPAQTALLFLIQSAPAGPIIACYK
jgi:hypothetical protein